MFSMQHMRQMKFSKVAKVLLVIFSQNWYIVLRTSARLFSMSYFSELFGTQCSSYRRVRMLRYDSFLNCQQTPCFSKKSVILNMSFQKHLMFDYLLTNDRLFRWGVDAIFDRDLLLCMLWVLLSQDLDLECFVLFRVELKSMLVGVFASASLGLAFMLIVKAESGWRSVYSRGLAISSSSILESMMRVTSLTYFFFSRFLGVLADFINNGNILRIQTQTDQDVVMVFLRIRAVYSAVSSNEDRGEKGAS